MKSSKTKKAKQYPFRANRAPFCHGLRDGLPIGLGYLAVSFSLGIAARTQGLSAIQGFVASFLCNASAGEHMGFLVIGAGAGYLQVALATLIANARYLLMSCALGQRMSPDMPLGHRMLVGFDITDEVFGITIARPGYLNPWYTYGAMVTSIPFWATGTALGILAGNLMPARLVSAFGVALYGMFLAVIIPPARKNRLLACLIAICFAASFAASRLPLISTLSDGTRTIILTVIIASSAAILFPHKENENKEDVA